MSAEQGRAGESARGWHVTRRDGVILGITLAIALGAVAAAIGLGNTEVVHVVNGLDVPVRVSIDGDELEVGPGARVEERVFGGVHRVRVTGASGALLEEELITVPVDGDVVVYNVLGAAPVYLQSITYTAAPARQDPSAVGEFLGGARLVARDHVKYVFEEPPRSISVKQRTGSIVRHRVDVAPGGWRATVGYFEQQGHLLRAAEIARAVALAEPAHADPLGVALALTKEAQGPAAATALAREAHRLAPESPLTEPEPDGVVGGIAAPALADLVGSGSAGETVLRWEPRPGAP